MAGIDKVLTKSAVFRTTHMIFYSVNYRIYNKLFILIVRSNLKDKKTELCFIKLLFTNLKFAYHNRMQSVLPVHL